MTSSARLLVIAATIALLASSCTAAQVPGTTAATAATGPVASTSPTGTTASTAPAGDGHPIVVQVNEIPSVSNWLRVYAGGVPAHLLIARMVHSALYRHDATLAATPDLAAEPCEVAQDLVTITCSLRSATFHDSSPVTAQDVAYVYELAMSPACVFAICLGGRLRAVEAVDERTVRFTLERPYAPFLASSVAEILVEPRARIESAYETFAATVRAGDPDHVESVADRIREGLQAPEPDCEGSLEVGEGTLQGLGVELTDRRLFPVQGGAGIDACAYAEHLAFSLAQAAASMRAEGIDAVAAAYPLLSFTSFATLPIGAGPWRIAQFDPEDGLVLKRHESYHHGAARTSEVRIRVMQDEAEIASAMIEGAVDWLPPAGRPTDHSALRDQPSVRSVVRSAFEYSALQYNVRPGRLFSDLNLRKAVELCIDKERIIEAGPAGAVPIYSAVPPRSWAYQAGLAKPRDVDEARRLIEASGWTPGADGIYERGGERLSFEVPVRADVEPAVALLDRAAARLRDCGMELIPRPADFPDLLAMLETFPHLVPGTSEPFEAYLGGWGMAYDPDVSELFHSDYMTVEGRGGSPYFNYIGYSNPRVDELLDAGLVTYDQAERSAIYREMQRILAEEQPYLFLSALPQEEAVDADLASTSGPLDLQSPNWWWALETLMNPSE